MKRFLGNVVVALVALVAVMAATEFVLRATHLFGAHLSWTEPDPLIGWRFTPGREYWFFKENDHAITGRINAHGWRDHPRREEKPEGDYRVAVIGDSYVEAFQVELDSTFCAIAERALSRDGRRVEVMNFGRSGMTQTEELLVLERDVAPFAPDAVVELFVPHNYVDDIAPATAHGTLRPFFHLTGNGGLELDTSFNKTRAYRMKRRVNWLKQHSILVSLAAERYNAFRGGRRQRGLAAREGSTLVSGTLTLCTDSPDPRFARNYALCKRIMGATAAWCRERGVAYALASVPIDYRPAEAARYRAVAPSFNPSFFEQDLAAWADSAGVGFIPLEDVFHAHYMATGKALHWSHWNYTGHRVAAQALVRWVRGVTGKVGSAGGERGTHAGGHDK